MRHPVVRRKLARGRKARARVFYKRRRGRGHDVLPADEAEAMRPWAGCASALLLFLAAAAIGCCAADFVEFVSSLFS